VRAASASASASASADEHAVLLYGWPQELLALTSGIGAVVLIALIIRHSTAKASKGLVGTYRTLGSTPQ